VEVSGVLRMMPVANPLAFERLTRNTPLDMTNLNRVFPGDPAGWLTERLAYCITQGFLKTVDYYVDLHAGGAQPPVDYVYILNAENLSMAFGSRVLYRASSSYAGSTSEITTSMGIPTVVVELGGGPNCEEHIERAVTGVLNIMRATGMLPAANDGAGGSRAEIGERRGGEEPRAWAGISPCDIRAARDDLFDP